MSQDRPPPAPSSTDADWKENCANEFERYYKERDDWARVQQRADENYDTLLVTISTLALGTTLTKEWTNRGNGAPLGWMIFAWICFALCLISSLLHRLLTYTTHQKLIERARTEFINWKPGAIDRIAASYDTIPFIKRVEWLKYIGLGLIVFGIVGAFISLVSFAPPSTSLSQPVPTINQYFNLAAGTTSTATSPRSTDATTVPPIAVAPAVAPTSVPVRMAQPPTTSTTHLGG